MKKSAFPLLALALTLSTARADGAGSRYDITVSQDFSHTAYQTVDEKGGTVTATAADGTVYTLTLPEGALGAPTRITLTPVAAQAQNFPFAGGISGGAQLEPEGLILLKPASLTIQLAQAPDPRNTAGFCHSEDGVDFHLCPMQASGNTITFTLSHFSGYGVTPATPDQAAEFVGQHQPPTRQSRAEQLLAQAQQQEVNGTLSQAQFEERGQKILGAWSDGLLSELSVMVGAAQKGDVSEAEVFQLGLEYGALGHYKGLVGFTNADDAEAEVDLQILLDDLANQELRHCWDPEGSSSVLSEVIVKALRYSRMAELIGGGGEDAAGARSAADLMDKIGSCLRFKVEVHSGMQTLAPMGTFLAQLDGSFNVSADNTGTVGALTGDGLFNFSTASTTTKITPSCTVAFHKGPFDGGVFGMRFDETQSPPLTTGRQPVRPGRPVPPPPPNQPAPPPTGIGNGNVASMVLSFAKELPDEKLYLKCVKQGHTIRVPLATFWATDWSTGHKDEASNPNVGLLYTMKDFTARNKTVRSLVSTKDYNRSFDIDGQFGQATVQEITEIQVTHTPSGKPNHTPPIFTRPTLEGLKDAYSSKLKPRFAQAETDELSSEKIERDIEKWYVTSLVFKDALKTERDEAQAEVLKILNSVVSLDEQACAAGHLEMGARMLYWYKWAMGHDLVSRQPGFDRDALIKKIEGCFTLGFNFSSEMKLIEARHAENGYDGLVTADGTLTASLDPENEMITLSGAPNSQYAIIHYPQGECKVKATPVPGSFEVVTATVRLRPHFGEEKAELRSLALKLGAISENALAECPNSPGGGVTTQIFSTVFNSFHLDEKAGPPQDPRYELSEWQQDGSGSPWAVKIIDNHNDKNRSEHTELRLIRN